MRVFLLQILFIFSIMNCGGKVRYDQSTQYPSDPSDSPNFTEKKNAKSQSALTYKEKKKWNDKISFIQENYQPNSYKYNNLLAHCYKNLRHNTKAAKSYAKAAKLASTKAEKKEMHRQAIASYAAAGLASELSGDYQSALGYYEECNRYCKYYGFGTHIPHDRIEHLKMKLKNKN